MHTVGKRLLVGALLALALGLGAGQRPAAAALSPGWHRVGTVTWIYSMPAPRAHHVANLLEDAAEGSRDAASELLAEEPLASALLSALYVFGYTLVYQIENAANNAGDSGAVYFEFKGAVLWGILAAR